MQDITDFYFQVANQLWHLVISQWILSVGVIIIILGWIISLINGSRQQ